MRRFLALATLLVLSLSRFGAPAPVHARTWVVDRVTSELGAAVPGARLAAPAARELAQRVAPRATTPWLPLDGAERFGLELASEARPCTPAANARSPLTAWHRFTYDATAPPRLS
jgi:hypothetical protein